MTRECLSLFAVLNSCRQVRCILLFGVFYYKGITKIKNATGLYDIFFASLAYRQDTPLSFF